jgi:hypothetical protein
VRRRARENPRRGGAQQKRRNRADERARLPRTGRAVHDRDPGALANRGRRG